MSPFNHYLKSRFFAVLGLFFLLGGNNANAQNCSVNAGVNELICKNQPFILKGEANGLFYPGGNAIWSQIAGPSLSLGNQVVNGGSIRVNVNGSTQGQTYEFRITARCADGSQVSQEVTFTTLPSTVANAGPDIPQLCAGNVVMAANAPITPLETGTWRRISGPNVTIVNPNSPTTSVIIPEGTTGMTVLRWTIMNTNGCSTSSTVAFTSTGVGGTVSAGPDQSLSECYNLTQSTNLQGSYAGNGTFGQIGTWTFLSGPSTPAIGNVNSNNTSITGLIQGVYKFRWTVTGPCASGSDEVSITVPAPKQAITSAGEGNRVFCDNTTSTVFSANPPALTNETAVWSVVSGSGTIVSPNSPTTTITGLTPGSPSTFRYTITNNVTGCVSAGNYSVFYATPPSISFNNSSTFLPFPQTTVSLPFTFTGGTQTTWQLISGPSGSTLAPTGSTGPQGIGNNTSLDLEGLDQFGTYRFRLVRNAPGGLGGCPAAFADAFVVASVAPTPSNPGTDILLACNIFHADLAANQPLVGTGSWSMVSKPIGAPDPTIANPFSNITDVTGLVNGVYFFRWLITGGVGTPDQQADVKVVVASVTPTTASAGPNETICAGSPYKMKANSPALNETGTWTVSPSAGITFDNVNDPNTKVTGLAAGSTYTFTWTITNSCGTSFSSVVINTTSSLGPNLANAGPDQCLGAAVSTFQLAGNAPVGIETGNWKMVSGPMTPTISNASLYNTSVTGASNGTYLFEWSLSTPGCASNRDTVMITASAPATQATATQSIVNTCGVSSVTLNGNTPIIGTGLWTLLTGPGPVIITNPSSPTSTVTFLSPNFSYTFRWTISNGACPSSSADVKFNISAAPSPVTVGPNQVVCGGTSTALSASTVTSGTGLWVLVSGPNAPTFSNFSDPGATISGLVEGVYQLKWTANNGVYCPPEESGIMTVTVRENATANVLAGGTCNASVVQLQGNNGTTGTWTQVVGPNSAVITSNAPNTAIASGLIPGTYTFRYTLPAAGSCAATSATTSITLYAEPTIALAGADQNLCNLSSTTLAGNLPVIGTGLWTVVDKPVGSSPIFTNAASPTSGFTNMMPGDYLLSWSISNGSCTSNSDLVRISYYAPPTVANAGPNQNNGCSSEIFLNGNTPTSGIGTWTQISGAPAVIDAPNVPNSRVHNTAPGVYQFMWTISNGTCQSSTSVVTITVSSIPPTLANAGPDQNICNTGISATATLAAVSPVGAETGLWTVQSKPSAAANPVFTDATLYNSQISGLVQGNYVLLWTVTNGACQSSSSVTLRVTNQPTPANAGADFSACLFNVVALNGNVITTGTGTWTVISKPGGSPDPVFDDAFSPTTKVFGLVVGSYTFNWSSSNGAGCAVSNDQVNVQMVNPPTPAQAGNFQTICVGTNATMSGNSPTSGVGTWTQLSGAPVTIVSPNAYNTTITGFVAGVYTFSWTIENGGCVSSDQTQITVQPAIGNNTIGSPQIICSGSNAAALTGTLPTGGNGSSYTYQWQRSTTSALAGFANIAGANSINYSPGTLTTTTWYQRTVTSGACVSPFTSNVIEVFVDPPISNNIISLPLTNVFCQEGNPEALTGTTASGGDGINYTYQWQRSTTSASAGFTDIVGETGLNYDPPLLTQTTWYRRVVNSRNCVSVSSALPITIYPYPVLTSFTNTTRCNNLTFTYTATSSVNFGTGTSYAWSQTSVPDINAGAAATGNTSAINLGLNNTANVPVATQFFYTLTANGCTNPTVFTLTVTVNPTPTVDIPIPMTQTVCNGLTTTAITFTGSPVAGTVYNWANNTTSIGLAASGSGTINSFTAVNTSNVDVVATITVTPMSNGCNGLPRTATITVHPTPNINTIATSTCSGVAFTVTPTHPTNGVIPANTRYSWAEPSLSAGLSGGNSGSNATNISGIFSHISISAETATYTVTPSTLQCGDAKPFTLIVTINPVPDIQPMTTTVCAGITFQASPVNPTNGRVPPGTRYTWLAPTGTGFTGGATQTIQQNFISGNLTNTISTITTATYIVTPVTGSCTGLTFTLQVELKPKAIINPLSQTICSGQTFGITPTNPTSGIVPNLTTYTWANPTGTALVGLISQTTAVSQIFGTLTNTSNIARSATYQVTPLSGDCTGNLFSITVWVNPKVSINTFSRVICSGVSFSLSAINVTDGIVPAGTQYTWQTPELTGTLSGGSSGGPASSITGNLSHTDNVTQTATFSVIPTASPCGDGTPFSLVLYVNPIPIITSPAPLSICGGVTFVYTPTHGVDGSIPLNTRYAWPLPGGTGYSGASTGSNAVNISGTISNSSGLPATATYQVTPTAPGNCAGNPFTLTVSLVPNAFISALSTTTCSGVTFQFTPPTGIVPSGTLYNWSAPTGISLSGGSSGSGLSIISGTLDNSSNITRTATYIVTPVAGLCTGNNFTLTVFVSPVAQINNLTTSVCSGAGFSITPSQGTNGIVPSGTQYQWLEPVGSGFTGGLSQATFVSSISGTLANSGSSTVTAVYTVTPRSGNCNGNVLTLLVTLLPKPAVNSLSSVVCTGFTFTLAPADLTDGNVPLNTTYTWNAPTGSGFTGGLTQSTGVSNISGRLFNATAAVVTAVYQVIPSASSCAGNSFTVTVTVKPQPVISSMTAATCSGVSFAVTPVTSGTTIVPAGTLYTWPTPTGSGFTGGVAATAPVASISGTLTMNVNVPASATYIITPQANGCIGNAFTLVVDLQPKAVVNTIELSICSGIVFVYTPTNSINGVIPSGTQYRWSAPIGTGFSGGVAQSTPQFSISGKLSNTGTSAAVAVYTVTPVFGTCSSDAFSLTINLQPQAFITSYSGTSCSGVSFSTTPTSGNIIPDGTAYTWTVPAGTGFTGGSAQNTPVSVITGNLTHNSTNIVTAVYTITPTTSDCQGTVFTYTMFVAPVPSILSMTSVICSGSNFNLVPASPQNGIVPGGTLYSWTAPSSPGISGTSAGNSLTAISGNLVNTTAAMASVTYLINPLSGSCAGQIFSATIFVKPIATIGSALTATCSGNSFTLTPQNGINGTVPVGTVYNWGLPQGTGFTNGAVGNLSSSISGSLINQTSNQVTATYLITPVSDNCAGSPFTLTVQVNSIPALSSAASGGTICSGEIFNYTPTSATNGTNINWTYITTSGLTATLPLTGTGNISQTLTNTTNAAITATYLFTLTANGCTSQVTNAVSVLVKPTPTLSSSLTPANIYTGTVFNYTATGNVSGTNFSWTRAAIPAINNNTAGSGSSATIAEVLTNNSQVLVAVPYRVVLTAAGCSNTETVTVNVVPQLVLSSTLTPDPVCSGVVFNYTATSDVAGVTFIWKRNPIGSINNNTGNNGTGTSIAETLTSSAIVPVSVIYDITLTAFGLSNTQQVTVVVQPTPNVSAVNSQTLCNQTGTAAVIFSGNIAGTNFNWTNNETSIGLLASGTGNINSFTAVNTGNSAVTARVEVTPVSNSCAGMPVSFSITVLPTPNISSPLTATAVCSGTTFNYSVSSNVAGTQFSWQREAVTGITASGSLTGTGNITSQILRNLTSGPLVQTYLYNLSAAGCTISQRVAVEVIPEPVLTSTGTPPPINGGNEFNYTPGSSLPGTSFNWSRAAVPGITNAAETGTNAISEILFNPTTSPITVTYIYTLQAGGCTGSGEVKLLVRPNRTILFPGAIGGTQAICIGTAAGMLTSLSPATGGNGTYAYQWQISTDDNTYTNIPGATALTYSPGVLSQTSYFRRVVVSGDQEVSTLTVVVTVNKAATPVVTPAGPLFLVTGGNFTLTSTTAAAYLWSNSATTQNIVVNTAGGYRVTITDANGCKDSSNLVAVSPPPPTTINATYIIGNPANPPNSGGQVTGLPGSTLRFYLLPTGGTPAGPPALPGSPGTYTYYVSQVVNGYESIRVPYTVTMIEPFKITDPQKVLSSKPEMQPDGSFIIKFTFFINNTSTVLLDSIRMSDDLTRVFPTGVVFDVISIRASGNLVANQQYNGSSIIHLLADVSKMNPGTRDSINLAIRMVPNGFYGTLKNSATLTAQTSFGALTITSNDPSVSTGVGSREPTPFEIPGVEIFVPGGFSPNQDGMNDYFVIRRPSQTTIQLEIFNRWGNLIYRSADYKNDWNGRTNQPGNVLGPEIPDGTYYYIINGTDRATGKVTRLNGYITLKR